MSTITCPDKNWEPVDMALCKGCMQRSTELPSNIYCQAMINAKQRQAMERSRKIKRGNLLKEIENLTANRDKLLSMGKTRDAQRLEEQLDEARSAVIGIALEGRMRA